jgi:nucleotide-binding universal stress UspA family protein
MQAVKKAAAVHLKETGAAELKVQTRILTGNPSDEIIKYAESLPDSHILMATHGQSGVGSTWSLGSVADKVVRGTTRPVGLVRAAKDKPAVRHPARLEKILAPLDGSRESETSVPYIRYVAARLKAKLTFLYIHKAPPSSLLNLSPQALSDATSKIKEYLKNLVADFKSAGIEANLDVVESNQDIASEIDRYGVENNHDLVIMATYDYSLAHRLILGSVSNNLAHGGSIPLIIIKAPVNKEM